MTELEYVWIRNYETTRTIAKHAHECYEFVYYIKGTGTAYLEEKEYAYSSGTCVLIPPKAQHCETHKELTSMIAIGFTLKDYFYSPDFVYLSDEKSRIFDLVQKIRHEFKAKAVYHVEYIESVLNELMIELFRMTQPASVKKLTSFDYVISYLKEYFMADIDIKAFSKNSGYCVDHFRTLFKEKTGLSPKEFVLNERLKNAKHFLEDQSLSLERIAEKCGFQYYSQFSLFFKKKTGLSPSEYRKSLS